MLRGANQNTIFHDEEDFRKFLYVLSFYKNICNYKILAYCLMKNHVHLLIQENGEELSLIIKRMASKYVYWYNAKYNRIGHLYQDRYRSEPVEDDVYFMTVLRYIHQNPVKAGITKNIEDYKFSSYNEYLHDNNIVDTSFALEMMDINDFVEFHKYYTDEKYLEISARGKRLTDEHAVKMFNELINSGELPPPPYTDSDTKTKIIQELLHKGVSIRQISKITFISKKTIELLSKK